MTLVSSMVFEKVTEDMGKGKTEQGSKIGKPEERVGMSLERKALGEIQVTLWVKFCFQMFGVLNK